MRKTIIFLLVITALFHSIIFCHHAIIMVIDGARYSETFGADSIYIPHIWNQLRVQGTMWIQFYNEGITKTDPGHASISTGVREQIDNRGHLRPQHPTIFEYLRKATNAPESSAAVVVGKDKLDILTYSTHPGYGESYKAGSFIASHDTSVVQKLKEVLHQNHPRLVIVNLPTTDIVAHRKDWEGYLMAIRRADSLVAEIWSVVQADSIYHNNTTLFITNDHGRHDDLHGGFADHGDSCNGCRHIMLLAIGKGFPKNRIVLTKRTQCDIAPTIGELLSFPTPYSTGTSLLGDTVLADKILIR
jgi:phosphopentomutase